MLYWTHCATSPRVGWNRHLMRKGGGGGGGVGPKLCSNGPEPKTDFNQDGLIGTLGMSQTVNLQCFQGELKAEKNPVHYNK